MSTNRILNLTLFGVTCILLLSFVTANSEIDPFNVLSNPEAITFQLNDTNHSTPTENDDVVVVIGKDCDPARIFPSETERSIDVSEESIYEIYARTIRGDNTQTQLEERYRISVNGEEGQISEDDLQNSQTIRIDFLGEFGLGEGENSIKIINEGQCYEDSANSIHVDAFYIVEVEEPVYGCMDDDALNYNSGATEDDGSCYYEEEGCTDHDAINYDPDATDDDDSCKYKEKPKESNSSDKDEKYLNCPKEEYPTYDAYNNCYHEYTDFPNIRQKFILLTDAAKEALALPQIIPETTSNLIDLSQTQNSEKLKITTINTDQSDTLNPINSYSTLKSDSKTVRGIFFFTLLNFFLLMAMILLAMAASLKK